MQARGGVLCAEPMPRRVECRACRAVHGVLLLDDGPREQLIEHAEAILRDWTPWVTDVEVWSGTSAIYRSAVPPQLDMAAD